MVEELIIEKDNLAEKLEKAEKGFETASQRVKSLEEEKELLQLELEEALLAQGIV